MRLYYISIIKATLISEISLLKALKQILIINCLFADSSV